MLVKKKRICVLLINSSPGFRNCGLRIVVYGFDLPTLKPFKPLKPFKLSKPFKSQILPVHCEYSFHVFPVVRQAWHLVLPAKFPPLAEPFVKSAFSDLPDNRQQ